MTPAFIILLLCFHPYALFLFSLSFQIMSNPGGPQRASSPDNLDVKSALPIPTPQAAAFASSVHTGSTVYGSSAGTPAAPALPVTRSELVSALELANTTDLAPLALIRRCAGLCDDIPSKQNSVWNQLLNPSVRPLLVPAALGRIAAPSTQYLGPPPPADWSGDYPLPLNYQASSVRDGWRPLEPLQVAGVLVGASQLWLKKRYVPLAHAEIRRLWPELSVRSLRELIIQYFGDG
jgi:hypothetical protein